MKELLKLKTILPFVPAICVMVLVTCIVMIISSSSADNSEIITSYFSPPFSDGVSYIITSKFGKRINPITDQKDSFHNGIDLVLIGNHNVVAPADGQVIDVMYERALGNIIVIEHKFDDIVYQTVYAHLLDNSIIVSEGQWVFKKEKIAVVGNTGTMSTGTHLHFEVHTPVRKYDGKTVIDPIKIIEGGKE